MEETRIAGGELHKGKVYWLEYSGERSNRHHCKWRSPEEIKPGMERLKSLIFEQQDGAGVVGPTNYLNLYIHNNDDDEGVYSVYRYRAVGMDGSMLSVEPHTVPVSSTGTRQEELLEFDMVTLGHDGDFDMHIKQWACYGYGDDRDGSMSPLGGGE
jgi:hypothetical protein